MNLRNIAATALKYGVRWNVIKLTWAVGAVCGMLWMAVLMTFTKALAAVTGVVP